VLHQPDQCRSLLWKFSETGGESQQGPVWPVLLTSLIGAGQCARVASSAAFSSLCRWLLVPRTNSTPVFAWSWTTWVVESETCFGSRVRLVGVLISFEKNFYWLPFTPPSLVRLISPSLGTAFAQYHNKI
jgi:hypothetical protein